jgi:hypothetical protein
LSNSMNKKSQPQNRHNNRLKYALNSAYFEKAFLNPTNYLYTSFHYIFL